MILYLFDRHEELIGSLNNQTLSFATQTEHLSSTMTLTFGINNNDLYLMENVDRVAHADIHNPERFHMYKIFNTTNEQGQTTYQCVNIFFEEIRGYGYLQKFPTGLITADAAVAFTLENTKWKLVNTSSTTPARMEASYLTPLDALRQILDTWECEIKYYITISGNQISSRNVEVHKIIGEETGRRFVYGHNAIDVVKEEITADLFTAIIPLGTSEKVKDPITNKETGEREYLRIDNVTWLISEGKPLDKPKGQEYLEHPERTKLFGYSDGQPIFKVVEYADIEDRHELIKKAYQDLETNSRPKVHFRMTAVDTEMLNVGDIVSVIRHDIELYYKTRVFKVERDLISGSNKSIEFGDNLDYSQAKKNLEYIQMREKDKRSADQRYRDSIEAINREAEKTESEIAQLVKDTQEQFEKTFFDEDGYNYDLRVGNEYNLPSGYYSFNRPIDKNPTKAIYVGAGKIMISDSKDSWGNWRWSTAADGSGIVADMITAGVMNANLLRAGTIKGKNSTWNLETGYFNIGNALIHNPNGSIEVGSNLIGTDQLQYNSVGYNELQSDSVGTTHIRNAAIGNAQIARAAIGSAEIQDGVITNAKIDRLDARYINLNGVSLENFIDNRIDTRGFTFQKNGDFDLNGKSVAVGSDSNYITIKDRGGRGEVKVQGTVGAWGSNYSHELNSGGLYLNGVRLHTKDGVLYAPEGLQVGGHQLYVNGVKIDKYIANIVNSMR